MRRYDTSIQDGTVYQRMETPLAIKVILGAGGLAFGSMLIMLSFDVEWAVNWRVSICLFAGLIIVICLAINIGSIRKYWIEAFSSFERATGVNWDGVGGVGEPELRFIPVKSSGKLVTSQTGDIYSDDLRYMIQRLNKEKQTGWTVREWMGVELPSGRTIVSTEQGPYPEFIEHLKRIGALKGHKERHKGQLVMDSGQILMLLGL